MKHAEAFVLAEEAMNRLRPHAERITIAGSIRRMKPEVRDIEILVIPKHVHAGLFSDELEVDPDFCAAVRRWHKAKGEPTGKYTQRVLPGGLKLDMFITHPGSWGYQLVLRTGSEGFNRTTLLPALKARGYVLDDGSIWREGQMEPTPEETDVFRLSGLAWLEPWQREE